MTLLQAAHRMNADYAEGLATLPGEQLGLASIQAYCREQGIRVDLVDGIIHEHRSCEQTFAAIEQIAAKDGAPVLVGFSGTSVAYRATARIAQMCKDRWPGVRTIHGHEFASLNHHRILARSSPFDFVCRGDGEHTFATLSRRLLDGKAVDDVPGLVWRDESGTLHETATQPSDMNAIPWPSRETVAGVKARGLAISMFTSRGCPFRCAYCATGEVSSLNGKACYRTKEPENVVEEMRYLVKNFDLAHVTIVDDNFLINSDASRDRARRIAEGILRTGLKLTFAIDVRIDAIERDVFTLLHRAGLRKAFVGVETANPEQLKTYHKSYQLGGESQRSRLAILNDIGIKVHPGIIMYHPTVTPAEMRATAQLIHELGHRTPQAFCSRLKLYPGTKICETYRKKGWTIGEWPTEDWRFVDPRAQQIADAMLEGALYADTGGQDRYDILRGKFLQLVDAWERGHSLEPEHRAGQLDSGALQRSSSA